MNDYRKITFQEEGKERPIQVSDTNQWHQEELNWLQNQIELAKQKVQIYEFIYIL